jgi:hypothetical protein
MKKNVLNEIDQMKYLFGYKPGKVISEQKSRPISEMDYTEEYDELDEMEDVMDYTEEDIEMDPFEDNFEPVMSFDGPDVAPAPTKPDVMPDVTPEKPVTRPGRPNRDPAILPDVDPHPQGKRRRRMRDMDVDIDMDRPSRRMRDMDRPSRRMRDMDIDMDVDIDMDRPSRRMRDMDETIYEIEIDGDIEELFKK